MSPDVIAFPRRSGICLAAVSSEQSGADMLELVAEDGAAFSFPAARALCRVSGVGGPDTLDERGAVKAWLGDLRGRLQPFDDWCRLHGELDDGARLDAAAVANEVGLAGALGVLRVGLGAADADPWFRVDGGQFVVVPTETVLRGLLRRNEELFLQAGDDAVTEWWPRGERVGVPRGWRGDRLSNAARIATERARWLIESRYDPDAATAARAALDALRDYALRPGTEAAERGAALARRLTIGDEPDRALEGLVLRGALPDDVDPTPSRAGLDAGLGDEALAEAGILCAAASDLGDREDLTGLFTVAVDSADTREVDDAFSFRADGDGGELFIHVADAAASIAIDGPLDVAARSRASSLFSPDGSILMLPPELVVGRLALSAEEARPAVTCVLRLDADGRVVSSRFTRSAVRLTRRVTYADARDPACMAAAEDDARRLVAIAQALLDERRSRGARILRLPELVVDARGEELRIDTRQPDGPGDLVVMETMVAYSAHVGATLAAAGAAAIFRTQDEPREPATPLPAEDDPLFAPRVRRTFAPVNVSATARPHRGVAADAYAQATSPIRRCADLVNQRQLVAVIAGDPPPYDEETLGVLGPELLHRERAVRRAAGARSQYWIARSLEDAGRTSLDGFVTKLPRRGLGAVWVPELCRELPLRAPQGWRAPAAGTSVAWPIGVIAKWRGRIELRPPGEK